MNVSSDDLDLLFWLCLGYLGILLGCGLIIWWMFYHSKVRDDLDRNGN